MLKRTLTSIVIITLLIGSFALRFVSPYIFDAFIGIIAVVSTYEVCDAYSKNKRRNDKFIVMFYPIFIFGALLLCIFNNLSLIAYFGIILAIALVLLVITFIINLTTKNLNNKIIVEDGFNGTYKNFVANKIIINLFAMIYPAFILSLMFVINHLSSFINFATISTASIEFFVLVMIYATTIMTDTGAYLIGSGLKGKKLCPKISPNKTISGAVGGVVCSIAISLIVYSIFSIFPDYLALFNALNLNIITFVIYGFIASIVSQCGDLFASYIKRKNNIKDYGKIFPGHGGFMDRFDGTSFNVIFTLIFCLILFL